MGNPVVHFEVTGPDDEPLVKFYGELFGWATRTVPGVGYTLIDTKSGTGINGGIGKNQNGEAWTTFYVGVDDPQGVLDKAESLGAKTVLPVTEMPGMVTLALFTDPDGLLVGLVKNEPPQEGQPVGPSAGDGAPVDWFEVLGSDAKRTQAGQGIGGGLGSGEGPSWATVYAHVPDAQRALARAEQLGGTRVYGPNAVDDHMQTGAFRDPAGNVFGVYHHGSH